MPDRTRAARPGRNDRCPCGSGKKFKKCHLDAASADSVAPTIDPAFVQRRQQAARIQRRRQQGLGKPIISTTFKGERFIAVKNRLFQSERFRTFHDFLMRYITMALGPEWGTAELRRPGGPQHPVAIWYQAVCRHQRKFMATSGQIVGMPYCGAAAAYLRLAYDLYSLDHNAELQDRLLARLRNPQSFPGARYETYVAAIFVRAGFDLAFENEADGSTTHCEFAATHRGTGKRFSVEAKRRESQRLRFGRLFNDALTKKADHPRVVFMDINTRDDGKDNVRPQFMDAVQRRLRAFQGQPLHGQPRPSAYVIMTNAPWEYDLEGPAARSTFLADGFQIPDFGEGIAYPSLRDAINAREAHIEMHGLMQSIADHSEIPSTFDGEIGIYAADNAPVRVAVGSRYLFRDNNGEQRVGLVTTATVSESQGLAYVAATLDGDGKSGIYTFPLSEAELEAYRRHPDTFFGVPAQRRTRADSPLDLYDAFLSSYRHASKETLLGFMKAWPDQGRLANLTQPELASLYAESMAVVAWRRKDTA